MGSHVVLSACTLLILFFNSITIIANIDHKHLTLTKYIDNEFELFNPTAIRHPYPTTKNGRYEIMLHHDLINNGDSVQVSYTSTKPTVNDFIAAYSPADVDITKTSPIKFGYCREYLTYVMDGYGSLSFQFTNVRSDIKFYYFSNGIGNPILEASSSETVSFNDINEPVRPRIVPSRTLGDRNLDLLWSSATSSFPLLRWGTSPGEYTFVAVASTDSISRDELCGAPANTFGWRDLGLIHTATFSGISSLKAGQKIYYSFGDGNTSDFSNEKVFYVPPQAGSRPTTRPTTVIVFADMGRGGRDSAFTWNEYGRPAINVSSSIAKQVQAGAVDAIFHNGDISYAQGFMAVWDFFLDMISPIASAAVYLTTVGNHESDWLGSPSFYQGSDSGGECGVLATRLIPPPPPASLNSPWWSYDVGLIHFIGISTEHDFTTGSPQHEWLKRDLKAVNRMFTPWVILGGHRPMYINSRFGGIVSSDVAVMDLMIKHLEPLLWTHRVNLAFYGHAHVYQRHSAVYKKKVVQASTLRTDSSGNDVHYFENPQATVHIVVGTAGAHFYANDVTPPPSWNEQTFYRYGYARVQAQNPQTLSLEWVEASTDKVFDRIIISQEISTTAANASGAAATWRLPLSFFDEGEDKNDDGGRNEPRVQPGPFPTFLFTGLMVSISILLSVICVYLGLFSLPTTDSSSLGDSVASAASSTANKLYVSSQVSSTSYQELSAGGTGAALGDRDMGKNARNSSSILIYDDEDKTYTRNPILSL